MDFIDFRVIDVIDIFVVAILLWQIYRSVRGTAAMTIASGIFIIYILWIVVRTLGMDLLSMIIGQLMGVGALALIIVFQQEVRRYLLRLGSRSSRGRALWRKILSGGSKNIESEAISEIVEACKSMSETRTGALIAIEVISDLEVYTGSGDRLDATVSKRLIENIFFKNAPLHDGAMIIRNGRIDSVRCILPTSDNMHIDAHFGLRHRAALGLSENTDSMVVIVSEETGRISIAHNGTIKTLKSADELRDIFAILEKKA